MPQAASPKPGGRKMPALRRRRLGSRGQGKRTVYPELPSKTLGSCAADVSILLIINQEFFLSGEAVSFS
jgi:hypothetical protein